jgi:5-methylcytosine-specific restriction endonuclease McrA
MNYRNDWSFKDKSAGSASLTQPKKKKKKVKKPKTHKKKRVWNPDYAASPVDFYNSPEWRSLRYRVLKKYGPICMLCGATRDDGVRMHVDHIKPKSKFPGLALEFTNMQVLCEDCNLGKSNKDDTDWRPDETAHEIGLVTAAMERI